MTMILKRKKRKMRLGRKNLLYSMALAGVLLLFLAGYFMYMLPSLYVDHVMEQNLKSIREQHRAYVENGNYEGVQVKNATSCFSVEIPPDGACVRITGKAFSAEITLKDNRLKKILDSVLDKIGMDEGEAALTDGSLDEEAELIMEVIREYSEDSPFLPVSIRLLYVQEIEEEFYNESFKIHMYSDGVFIGEASVSDSGNHYTSYMAVEEKDGSFIFSFLPVMTPDADEIRPVVLQSLPMLAAVIVLIVLLSSGMYSKGIVQPIVELVQHTEQMKHAKDLELTRMSEEWPERTDEVRELADTLDDYYHQVREGYRKLEEENKRQEVFLRASSHQLKTPIAAALLLADGMINQVGRYRDTKVYLPKVKEQLLSMRKMVEDILYLNHCAENMQPGKVELGRLLEEKLRPYQVSLAEKKISVRFHRQSEPAVWADEVMAAQILDNLLSNAVKYTPAGGWVRLYVFQEETGSGTEAGGRAGIRIENGSVTIQEELLPHIFEPFVSGNHKADTVGLGSHGMGLYIAQYYAQKMGACLTVSNGDDSVVSILEFS